MRWDFSNSNIETTCTTSVLLVLLSSYHILSTLTKTSLAMVTHFILYLMQLLVDGDFASICLRCPTPQHD